MTEIFNGLYNCNSSACVAPVSSAISRILTLPIIKLLHKAFD